MPQISPRQCGQCNHCRSHGLVRCEGQLSNFGSCIDVFAPGSSITSSLNTGNNAYGYKSGTSMAAPHVTGAAALYLQTHPAATPADVASAIIAGATPNVVTNAGTGSPTRLLHNFNSAPAGTSPASPTNLSCTNITKSSITLNWADNSSNETGFKVERSTNGGSTWALYVTLGAGVQSYTNSGLSAGSAYAYRVQAYNSYGVSAYTVTAGASTLPPTQVHLQGLSASAKSSGSNWIGSALVTVRDACRSGSPGATVTIALSKGASGTKSGVTNTAGQCTISTSSLKRTVASVTMTVTNIVSADCVYQTTANTVSPAATILKP